MRSKVNSLENSGDKILKIPSNTQFPKIPSKKIPIYSKIPAQSPLNYTGGKFRLLSQIYNKFPKDIDNFYDIFCGGFNVGANVEAKNIIGIDKNPKLITVLELIKTTHNLESKIDKIILKYNLSDSYNFGYTHYNCNSSSGLGSYNKERFNRLKTAYNVSKNPLLLLVLIIFSFNNQIRFNSFDEFNLPVGKRDFNANLRKKLRGFVANIQNAKFICKDFREIDLAKIPKDSFFYLDPPYILGTATYNENGGWGENDESDLFAFLNKADSFGIRFALSNVLEHKGKYNENLHNWCLESSFKIHHLTYNYANSSYQHKYKKCESKEVLVNNY
ncbi:Dam family site-specific DNA-(adenine-N6)-methyltransferase [Helicobacter sp. 16-1353]|uniref:Dam family site-specific DNA-(adenine-N6)-methyltransferase n=1 Tax=Helicobacter sp. 16-1353 TaxID=2004996 RepID=UPI000DD4C364|nr:Dam family site-specific DNA-(adenine-N6)-methyltransferase [Helicobacter sp. 16-1353]